METKVCYNKSMATDDSYRSRLLNLLRRDAVRTQEVVLRSGKRSLYLNPKRAILSAEGHFLVGWAFLQVLEKHSPDVRAVGGLALGADPLASAIATTSYHNGKPIDAFFVRKEAKPFRQYIECPAEMRGPVAIVEDVVNSGSSTLIAIKRARDAGLEVKIVITLIDREQGGLETLSKEAPAIALFKMSELTEP